MNNKRKEERRKLSIKGMKDSRRKVRRTEGKKDNIKKEGRKEGNN